MTAYIVFIRENTTDQVELDIYNATAPKAAQGHPVTALAFYGDIEALEGSSAEGAVILSFPSMAEAKAWYDSPLYQEAKLHRLKGANYRVLLIEGVS